MLNNLIAFTQTLADYALLLTYQLVLILIARRPVLQLFGAVFAYRLWLLPAIWAPLYFIDWSWFQVGVAQTWVADAVIGAPVNLMSPALEWLPEHLTGALPATQDEAARLARATRGIDWQAILGVLWVAELLTLLIRQGLTFCRFSAYVSKHAISVPEGEKPAIGENAAITSRIPIYTLAGLSSPALFGVIKPVLLLPGDFLLAYDSDQRHLILSHEAVHLTRRDNLWNLCAWSFKAMFWFNPLAHLAYRYYRADQELSCDALALTHSNARQRNSYARALLESFGKPGTCHQSPLLTAWGSLDTIKERTAMIKQYSQRKSSPRLFRVSLLSLMLAGAGITALMTDTLSPLTLAADAIQADTIPVDRASLSTTVADTADRTADLIGEREYTAAESMLNNLRALELTGELNAQERFLFWHLAGDLALAREDTAAAVDAYTTMLDMPELNRPQREDVMTQLAEAYIAAGDDVTNYKRALSLYTELAEMSDNSNPDHLFGIATTLNMLKQFDDALAATQEAIAAYGANAPRSAYELLWRLTPDPAVKREAHETLVEKFNDPHDAARLTLFTRENGSYNPNTLGGCFILDVVGGLPTTPGTCDGKGPGPRVQGAVVTPDNVDFGPSGQPLAFVKPAYPEKARLNGWVGQNLVMLDLDENGAVRDAVILMSNPDTTFNDATLAAITQFRFDRSQLGSPADGVNLFYISYKIN